MQQKTVDLFVIGGGINGVGVATDAAGRGLSVVLCEKDDLANHTSSASSKLIHGGLRYLEQYEFKLVREALREREILLHIAPHLVQPLEFVLPYDTHLRPAWMIRLGLWLYDYLASRKQLKRSQKINFKTDERGNVLQEKFRHGFSYMDCRTDDARLVVMNAMLARQHGALILTRHEVQKLERCAKGWRITVFDKQSSEIKIFLAQAVVNATGAWVADVLKNLAAIKSSSTVKWVKGSHFIVPKLYPGDHAYILQNPDQRIIFVIPYKHDYSLIGTTDVVYSGDLNHIEISKAETDYLLQSVNYYFKQAVDHADILWSYSGIRALYDTTDSTSPSKITREYHLEINDDQGHFPLLSIFGGKLTTYRSLAAHVLEKLAVYFPNLAPAWTANGILPGGDLGGVSFREFVRQLKKQYPLLSPKLLQRLAENYGAYALKILSGVDTPADLGQCFAEDLYAVEIDYLLVEEWAKTSNDILWRRTKLGISISPEAITQLEEYCSKRLKN